MQRGPRSRPGQGTRLLCASAGMPGLLFALQLRHGMLQCGMQCSMSFVSPVCLQGGQPMYLGDALRLLGQQSGGQVLVGRRVYLYDWTSG